MIVNVTIKNSVVWDDKEDLESDILRNAIMQCVFDDPTEFFNRAEWTFIKEAEDTNAEV